jgi:hypothetical protein
VIRPDLLPAQCEEATSSGVNPNTGEVETIQPFRNISPRLSVTYDLFGNGKTALKFTGGYFYQTKITLADSLGGLFTTTRLTWGSNASSGSCTGSSCWTDANRDGVIQANELTGTPSSSSSRFDLATGILRPAGNIVSEDAKLARTREVVTGVQHELMANLAVGVDYIYRRYDRGTATFLIGYQPGAPGYPLSNLYVGPLTYTDPETGVSAPYYVICDGCRRPSGVGNITVTNPDFSTYHGVDLTLSKRYSNRWQANVAVTLQTNPDYPVLDNNPTGFEFGYGINTDPRYLIKVNGSYDFPWGVTAAGNFIMNQGPVRVLTIDGPQDVYGGLDSAGRVTLIDYDELTFQRDDAVRYDPIPLLDLSLQKTLMFSERYRLKVMFDAFNVLNANTVTDYGSDNMNSSVFNSVNGIVPPRVFRIGAMINF